MRYPVLQFGRNLSPQLAGAPGDSQRCAFAEGGYDRHEPQCFEGNPATDAIFATPGNIYYPKGRQQQEQPESVCRATMVRSMTHKLIHRRIGGSELYDLQADPRELQNRHGDPALADVQSGMEKLLLDWFQETSDAVPLGWDKRGFS